MLYVVEIHNLKDLNSWYYYNHKEFSLMGMDSSRFKFLVYNDETKESELMNYDELPIDLYGRFDDSIYTWSEEDFAVMDCLEYIESEAGVDDSFINDIFGDNLHLEMYNNFSLCPSGEPVFTVPQLLRYLHQVRIGNTDYSDARIITKRLASYRGADEIAIHGVKKSCVFRIKDMEQFKRCLA